MWGAVGFLGSEKASVSRACVAECEHAQQPVNTCNALVLLAHCFLFTFSLQCSIFKRSLNGSGER